MVKQDSKEKGLHPRNIHNTPYNYKELIECSPKLAEHVHITKHDSLSIDFAKPESVMALNKALLKHFYKIENWEIPKGNLCPPIPGRVDYLHYIADLLAESNSNIAPTGKVIRVLDIGTGANCIYPILGNSVYGWKFVGTDISSSSINSAKSILKANKTLNKNIKLRFTEDSENIFEDVIKVEEKFDFTMCNPPFHASMEESMLGAAKKRRNLSIDTEVKTESNFAGKNSELWCDGGEIAFIKRMIEQSAQKKDNCMWFTTLVSKKENLEEIYKSLEAVNAKETRTIDMQHGHKQSRIVAWTFHLKNQKNKWKKSRW